MAIKQSPIIDYLSPWILRCLNGRDWEPRIAQVHVFRRLKKKRVKHCIVVATSSKLWHCSLGHFVAEKDEPNVKRRNC